MKFQRIPKKSRFGQKTVINPIKMKFQHFQKKIMF